MHIRECQRCGKIYKTLGKWSQICPECYEKKRKEINESRNIHKSQH